MAGIDIWFLPQTKTSPGVYTCVLSDEDGTPISGNITNVRMIAPDGGEPNLPVTQPYPGGRIRDRWVFFFNQGGAAGGVILTEHSFDQVCNLADDDTVEDLFFEAWLSAYGGATPDEKRGYARLTTPLSIQSGDKLVIQFAQTGTRHGAYYGEDLTAYGSDVEFYLSLVTVAFDRATLTWATKPVTVDSVICGAHAGVADNASDTVFANLVQVRDITTPRTVYGFELLATGYVITGRIRYRSDEFVGSNHTLFLAR